MKFGYLLLEIMAVIIPLGAITIIGFVVAMAISPKLRGKMMSRQIKATKYMLDESNSDLESMGTAARNVGIRIEKNVLDENEETLKDMAIREANISKEKVRITAKAIKDGLTKDSIYCKHCGEAIDSDSKFCKSCGNKL